MKSIKRWRRSDIIVAVICAWAALVVLFFLWQLLNYRGLVALAAEWQFNLFGRYYPTLVFLIFVLVFGFPIFLLVRGRWWEKDAKPDEETYFRRTIAGVTRFMRAMFAIAIGCAAVAILSLLGMFMLPSASGAIQPLEANLTAPLPTREGASQLDGTVLYSRTSGLDEDVWLLRHDTRFAPVVDAASQERTIRYFVELDPEERPRTGAGVERRRGILKRNALPGELTHLYRYAGFEIARPYFVLYASESSLRWPHLQTALHLIIAAVCFALLGLWQFFVRRRLLRGGGQA